MIERNEKVAVENVKLNGIYFLGVTKDGGFVYKIIYTDNNCDAIPLTFKIMSFHDGLMEITFGKERVNVVCDVISLFFSEDENSKFTGLHCLNVNYQNSIVKICKDTATEDIEKMRMKGIPKFGTIEAVDMRPMCQIKRQNDYDRSYQAICLRDLEVQTECFNMSFTFDGIFDGTDMMFRNFTSQRKIYIKSLEAGIVTLDDTQIDDLAKILSEIEKFFNPQSNFYGIKAVKTRYNGSDISVDADHLKEIPNYCRMALVEQKNSSFDEMKNSDPRLA
jgi:hypothetical protein